MAFCGGLFVNVPLFQAFLIFSLTGLRVRIDSDISKPSHSIFFLKAENPGFKIRNNSGSNTAVIPDYVCDLRKIMEFL